MDLKGNWDDHLPLIEYVYNISYHSSIQMTNYEAPYEEDVDILLGGLTLGKLS